MNTIRLLGAAALVGACAPLAAAAATPVCKVPTLKVLAQKSLGLSVMEKSLPDYEKTSGTRIEINYFGENDRRAKSRLDASTGAGSYQIYYVDEANVAEFASAGWIAPLLKYYPKEYDYDDFLPGRRAVASSTRASRTSRRSSAGAISCSTGATSSTPRTCRCRRRWTNSSPRSAS